MFKETIKLSLMVFIALFILSGCKEDSTTDPTNKSVASCEGCHTNYAHLEEVFTPDSTAPPGGCGGDAPHYEPFDRVFMGGAGYETYKKSGHYKIGCVGCHNGVDKTSDKKQAHSGNFVAHPSTIASEKCGSCHKQIVDNFKTSIHNGFGQKRKVCIRSGFTGPEDFDKLPAEQQKGYKAKCATCHANCGECHVIRPSIGGGGLINGHNFNKTPDMVNVCVACHTSRGGHAFLGVGSGTKPDVHQQKGFTCLSCHKGSEMHGDGNKVVQRYAYTKLPKCEDCHANLSNNQYHSMHKDDFNCQTCHSQVYNNCGSCHVNGAGARVGAYMDFKIGVNPIRDIKSKFKLSTVRRTLGAPDNWKEYGVSQYSNFDALPTYNFTTPHNILRWTERTKVEAGQSCSYNCHIRKVGNELINKKWYLFESDLLDWEKAATKKVTVDIALPDSWTK
jgi:thiosulfate/3-mercaptopyruvate sulfurtransferase